MITPKRVRGRPPIAADSPTTSITVKLSAKQFDAVHTRATVERVPFSEWVRRTLDRATTPRE